LTAVYIKNRVLHAANRDNRTPHETLYNEKPDLSNLRVFGCRVIYLNTNPKMKKLDHRGLEGIFAGYSERTKGYFIYDLKSKKFILSRSVKFIETINPERFHRNLLGSGLETMETVTTRTPDETEPPKLPDNIRTVGSDNLDSMEISGTPDQLENPDSLEDSGTPEMQRSQFSEDEDEVDGYRFHGSQPQED
jgi:hypothetical protein